MQCNVIMGENWILKNTAQCKTQIHEGIELISHTSVFVPEKIRSLALCQAGTQGKFLESHYKTEVVFKAEFTVMFCTIWTSK